MRILYDSPRARKPRERHPDRRRFFFPPASSRVRLARSSFGRGRVWFGRLRRSA